MTRTSDAEHLLDRWLADAQVVAPLAGRDLWLAEGSLLLTGWSEPHRRYHTTGHLAEVLTALDELVGSWMDRLQQISIIVRLFTLRTNTSNLTSRLADHVLCGHGVTADWERAPLSARQ